MTPKRGDLVEVPADAGIGTGMVLSTVWSHASGGYLVCTQFGDETLPRWYHEAELEVTG